jgi:uncharacterized membrane protein YozB (DUF420 family)
MLHWESFGVVLLIGTGLWYRHNRAVHPKLMASAFAVDFLLVLYIEITRHAVEKALNPPGPMVIFHAAVSVAVLATYVVMGTLGLKLLKGQEKVRNLHRYFGILFCALRGTNFITSFML